MKGLARTIKVINARLQTRDGDAPTSCKLEKIYVFLVLPVLRSVLAFSAGCLVAHEAH